MGIAEETVCIILAGGGGTRMASTELHKVCFPIVGRPAIVRAIDTYKAAGLKRFVVVIGQMAQQVIATVCQAHPEASFVYQAEPGGTGHAAIMAVDALGAQRYRGTAMVVMGDKVTRTEVVLRLLEHFEQRQPDMLLSTAPKQRGTSAGRVVRGADGRVLGIVELADIRRARRTGRKLTLLGRKLSGARVEQLSGTVNLSMYVFWFPALREALTHLHARNAQGELYLTDTAEYIARAGRIETFDLTEPTDLMAFNTPAELMSVVKAVRQREHPPRIQVAGRRRLSARVCKPASRWLALIEGDSPAWRRELHRTYGTDGDVLGERRKAMRRLVRAFARRHGPQRRMILCRAPGRINLMGRHVDHRGGFVNVMAVSREVLLAAASREDDVVTLRNTEPKRFPARKFRIQDLLSGASWVDWIDFVNSYAVRSVLDSAGGDWSHYARAPLLRLQHESPDVPLQGMDCIVSGNIPIEAGLSSSSALVVAFAEAAVALNRVNVAMRDFVDLCGEGEWFVGSRGRSADHAAIRTGRMGQVSRIGFFPFRTEGRVQFPSALRIVIAHSGEAADGAEVRQVADQRLACYELAEMFLRRAWPAAAGIAHLRDLAPGALGVRPGEVYRALRYVPDRPSRAKLRTLAPREEHEGMEQLFSGHADPGAYDLRGVCLFGLGEIVRSEQFAGVLRRAELDGVRRLMHVSHDGDRVARFGRSGKPRKHRIPTTDAALQRLADADADLAAQPGRYACSTPAIDQLVDLAEGTQGVVGAQLAGGGLGGCMMILVRAEALDALMQRLQEDFYEPRDLPSAAHVCRPVAGAGLLGA